MRYERLRELRKKVNLTQAAVGKMIGVDQRTYGNYELGNRDMSPEVLIKLADFYGVTIDYLLGRTDAP